MTNYNKINFELVLISLLLTVMAFFSYIQFVRIPIYVLVLFLILFLLYAGKKLDTKLQLSEAVSFISLILFIFFIAFQFLIIKNSSLLLSIASFLSGLGIIVAFRFGLRKPEHIIFIVNLYLLIHAFIGIIAIIQAFTGHLFLPHYKDPETISGLWRRPAGVEGMTYNFGKNYIFPIIFTFLAIKYKLNLYSKTFSRRYLKILLIFFLFILILSKTRSTQLTIISLSFTYLIFEYRLFKLKYIIFAILLFSIFAILVLMNLHLILDTSSYTRFVLWYAGYNMFLDHPLVGVGFGLFKENYDSYNDFTISFIGDNYDKIVKGEHNIIIGLITGVGIIGTFFISYSFYKYFRFIKISTMNIKDIRLRVINISIYYYLLGFILIDFQFHNYWNDNYVWFFIGISLAIIKINQKEINV